MAKTKLFELYIKEGRRISAPACYYDLDGSFTLTDDNCIAQYLRLFYVSLVGIVIIHYLQPAFLGSAGKTHNTSNYESARCVEKYIPKIFK